MHRLLSVPRPSCRHLRGWVLAIWLAVFHSATATILLEIQGIPGDTTLGPFSRQIVCDSIRLNFERAIQITESGAEPSKLADTFQRVELLSRMGNSTALLLRSGLSGARIDQARIHFVSDRVGPRSEPFAVMEIEAAYIQSWQTALGEDNRPREQIQLLCRRIALQTAVPYSETGSQPTPSQGWDFGRNRTWIPRTPLRAFVNAPPVAAPDLFRVPAGQSVKLPIASILQNDSDPDGDDFAITTFSLTTRKGIPISHVGNLLFLSLPDSAQDDNFEYSVEDVYGATTTGTVELMVEAKTPRMDLVATIERMQEDPSLFRIVFNGIPGIRYRIEYADSFSVSANWATLGFATADSSGQVSYIDKPGIQSRFYRLAYP